MVTLRLEDGRILTLRPGDPRLRTSTGLGSSTASVASAGTQTAAAATMSPAVFDPEKYFPAVPGGIVVVQSYDAAETTTI